VKPEAPREIAALPALPAAVSPSEAPDINPPPFVIEAPHSSSSSVAPPTVASIRPLGRPEEGKSKTSHVSKRNLDFERNFDLNSAKVIPDL